MSTTGVFFSSLNVWLLCLLVGGLSAADWSVRGIGGGGSMPTTYGTTAAAAVIVVVPDFPSTGFTLSGGRQSKVLENRDLCRIVTSYIPKQL